MTPIEPTRRDVLRRALQTGALALVGSTASCGAGLRRTPNQAYLELPSTPPGAVAMGLDCNATPAEICRDAVARITDLAWLNKGDSVFIKVACNSDNKHPAVTYPAAVEAMVALLRERGAGTIYVGDQAGVEHVRLTQGARESSTRAAMANNGLLAAVTRAEATLHCFDDQGWDGYVQPEIDFPSHWERRPWLPKILDQVDHIVVLPRLSSHALSGYTCGIKIAVGWLRDDSRMLLHQRGASFFEKIAEINYLRPLRDKLRLTLTLGTHGLLNIGPDFGSEHDFGGHFVIASTSLVNHDAIAAALIPWLDRHDASIFDLYSSYPADVDFFNRGFVADFWGESAMADYQPIQAYALGHHIALDPCLSRLAVLESYRPTHTNVQVVGDGLPQGMGDYLDRYSGRPFRLVGT